MLDLHAPTCFNRFFLADTEFILWATPPNLREPDFFGPLFFGPFVYLIGRDKYTFALGMKLFNGQYGSEI